MKPLHRFGCGIFASVCLLANPALAEQTEPERASKDDAELSVKVEDLKQAALELNRDLQFLEDQLLFPANTQVAVFVSLDVKDGFHLGAVRLEIDKQLVASHLYTDRQNDSLARGGIQRLYIGNLKPGKHQLKASYVGVGPGNKEYQRAATLDLEKNQAPTMVELRIQDTEQKQPEFAFKEWEL